MRDSQFSLGRLKVFADKRLMAFRATVLLIIGVVLILGARSRKMSALHPSVSATPAPELVGKTWLNSKPIKLAERRGKVTMVEFWTFACSNCQANLPIYERIWNKFGGPDFTIVSIHTPELPQEYKLENVKAFVREHQISYPVLVDDKYDNWSRWNQEFWPAIYLVDKRGNIREKWMGELNYAGHDGEAEVCRAISSLVAEQ